MKTYPVVIIGGGMAGASLALALANIGIENAVFEAFAPESNAQPGFDDRTVALSAASLNILKKLGLEKDLYSVAAPIKKIHVSDQGHCGFARIDGEECGVQALGAVIENWQLGQALNQAISKQSLIDYQAPAKVVDIQQSADEATLRIELSDGTEEVKAGLVVLADGARSQLRQQLHIDAQINDFRKSAVVCNLTTQLPHQNCAYERFTQDGPLALLPLTKNRMALVWSKPTKEAQSLVELDETEFAKQLEEAFGARLGKITKVGSRKSFPLIQLKAETLFRGRCVLIGNAAQSLHPIAGQGFNLGLRDVAELTEILASVKEVVEDSDQSLAQQLGAYQVLRQYQEKRQVDREQTLWVTESLARLFSNPWLPLSISRNLLLKAMDVAPVAKGVFASQAMGFGFNNSQMASHEE
ncbi:2-octaprenyl-6-methoxyphenyl hydroxylase [Kangiella sp.]|uniref:2-octaprenyl-6-methoxyphenyl hydroxylase n=1 Tax=Kangiella sp. TaxID=1920245 RepID=UPI003A8E7FCE